MEKLYKQLIKNQKEFIDVRRHFHMNPELSFCEEKTPVYIVDYLKKLGIDDIRTGVGGGGVVANIKGTRKGKTVALRADFDALPIQDEKNVTYASKVPGVMHACGHDAHTASLMAVAKVAIQNREAFEGNIRFIFQHAEEVQPGGAKSMIEDGCLDGVDAIFGNHMASEMPVGYAGYAYGPIMANSDFFAITLQGKGGHAAYPHGTVDPIILGTNIIQSFQQIVSRRVKAINPAVLSVTKFHAGTAFNIIPDTVELGGTVRTYDEATQSLIMKSMDDILKSLTNMVGAKYNFEYTKGYPAVDNTRVETEIVKNAINMLGLKPLEITPRMGGEDFAYYLKKVPGSFFYTGAGNVEKEIVFPHHHPRFDIDESSILSASKILLTVALKYLGGTDDN